MTTATETITASREFPPYQDALIKVDILHIDPEYQRQKVQQRVDRIVRAGWNPISAGAITVTERADKSLWIIDGQHRWEAAKALGRPHILAIIWSFVPSIPINEPQEFLEINVQRKALSSFDRFKAGLTAEDPATVEIAEVLRLFELRPVSGWGANSQSKKPGTKEIGAIRALFDIHKGIGQKGLYDTLDLIVKLWPDHENAFDQATIQGVSKFLGLYSQLFEEKGITIEDIARKITKSSLGALSLKAAANAEIYKGSRGMNLARAIFQEYNHHRSSGRLPNLFPEAK